MLLRTPRRLTPHPGFQPKALRSDTVGSEYLVRSTNLPSVSSFTMMGWFWLNAFSSFSCYMAYNMADNARYLVCLGDGDDNQITLYNRDNSFAAVAGAAVAVQQWMHLAMTCDGTDFLLYVNGGLSVSHTPGTTSTPATLYFGRTGDNQGFNGRMAGLKVFDRPLNAAEIDREMRQYAPVLSINEGLNSWIPAAGPNVSSSGQDYSDARRDFTVTGTLTLEDGPPIPWVRPARYRRFVDVPSAPVGSVAAAAGVGTATGVGAWTHAAVASAAGVGLASAVGSEPTPSTVNLFYRRRR